MRIPTEIGAAPAVVSVSELNRRVRALLENQFETLWVSGELSGVKRAASGHWYFCLKDPSAEIQCAMFRTRAQFLDFRPEDGLQVEVRARVTLYEPRGNYQLVVEEIRKAGRGALFEAFEKLKARLQAEGLFEPARKRGLPAFPRAIGIVTSPAAAALRDVLATLARRSPMVPVILYPAQVQGDGAAAQIARAIQVANARAECDVLIVCRGGGSLEDLWAFNEEIVARAIFASALPVVSGVGHETDFSIADFVADLRAPTPTAAAAAASPDRAALREEVAAYRRRLARDMRRIVENQAQRLDHIARRLLTPAERVARDRDRLAQLTRRLRFASAGAAHRLRRACAARCPTWARSTATWRASASGSRAPRGASRCCARSASPPSPARSGTSIPRRCSRVAIVLFGMPTGTCAAPARGSSRTNLSTSRFRQAARKSPCAACDPSK
jgi:exodeoxyribonuclease VII large subunit